MIKDGHYSKNISNRFGIKIDRQIVKIDRKGERQ